MGGESSDVRFACAPVALVVLSPDDVVLEENDAFVALGLGTWRDRRWTDLLTAGDRIVHETNVRLILLRLGHVEQVAATLRAGGVRVEGFLAYRMLDDGRTLVAFTAADERRRYEDELRAARDRSRALSDRLTCLARMSSALVRAVSREDIDEVLSLQAPDVLGVETAACWLVEDDLLRPGVARIDRSEAHPAWEVVLDGQVRVDGDAQFVPVSADDRVIAVLELRPPVTDAPAALLDSVVEQVGAAITRTRTTELALAHATRLSLTDPLTQVPNRRFATRELQFRASQLRPWAVALVDVDHFKRCNDVHGHDIGDAVLMAVASRMRSAVRDSDVVARWGGEEFLVLLDDPTTAGTTCERLRSTIGNHPVAAGGTVVPVTVSIGFTVAGPGEVPHEVLRRADAALYVAKRDGRNCVRGAEPGALGWEVFAPEVVPPAGRTG